MDLKYFGTVAEVRSYMEDELLATLRDDLNNMEKYERHHHDDQDREDMRNRIHDIEAVINSTEPYDNASLVQSCMEFSKHGALAQAFIIDAITKHAEAVAAMSDADMKKMMQDVPVHWQAWKGVAQEIKAKFEQFYDRQSV